MKADDSDIPDADGCARRCGSRAIDVEDHPNHTRDRVRRPAVRVLQCAEITERKLGQPVSTHVACLKRVVEKSSRRGILERQRDCSRIETRVETELDVAARSRIYGVAQRNAEVRLTMTTGGRRG